MRPHQRYLMLIFLCSLVTCITLILSFVYRKKIMSFLESTTTGEGTPFHIAFPTNITWNYRHNNRKVDYIGYEPPLIHSAFLPFIHLFEGEEKQHDEAFNFRETMPILESTFKCNGRNKKTSSVLFETCRFENICLNRRGEWILFTNSKKAQQQSGSVWVYTNAYYFGWKMQSFRIVVKDVVTEVLFKGNDQEESKARNRNTLVLSKKFKWVRKPTFAMSRHAISNIGHALMDNYLPLFSSMLMFDFVNTDNHILYVDSMGLGTQSSAMKAELTSLQLGQLFSKNTILEKCMNSSGAFIGKAYCHLDTTVEVEDDLGDEIDTCFSTLIAGSVGSFIVDLDSHGPLVPQMRKMILEAVGVSQPTIEYFRNRKTFTIAVTNKPTNSLNKDSIINAKDIVEFLKSNSVKILSALNHRKGQQYEQLQVVDLILENIPFEEQVKLFSEMDIYISSQGSASYMSMFMLNPNAVLIYTPMCFYNSRRCSDSNLKVHHHFSNLKVVSLIDHLHIVKCVKESAVEVGRVVLPLENNQKFFGDCHEKLDQEGLLQLITQIISGEV